MGSDAMIREAQAADYGAIRGVIAAAFGQNEEADIVERLRADGDVLIELAAEEEGRIVGQILYSRLAIERFGAKLAAAALAPVAVAPARQRSGIGGALVRTGNEICRARGYAAIVVLGHADYYPRFGFSARTARRLQAPFSGPMFMALELKAGCLKGGGRVRYAQGFGA
jgi:putative acetyltransferase